MKNNDYFVRFHVLSDLQACIHKSKNPTSMQFIHPFAIHQPIWRTCCVFQPDFGCCAHLKAGRNIFSAVFQSFLKKLTWKRQFRGTPSGTQPAFACWPALRSRQHHIFFVHFKMQMFFVDFSREITEALKLTKQSWKTAEKNVSTSFWVRATPKSWSKYTTKTC